jgi:hypothetical protein
VERLSFDNDLITLLFEGAADFEGDTDADRAVNIDY